MAAIALSSLMPAAAELRRTPATPPRHAAAFRRPLLRGDACHLSQPATPFIFIAVYRRLRRRAAITPLLSSSPRAPSRRHLYACFASSPCLRRVSHYV